VRDGVREATGTVIEETAGAVVLETRNGHRLKIRLTDIIRRKTLRN